ncbi:MAG: flagellar hook assembly protein FlgD [Planctomycetota bacterium]|jgi:flagellar basal-body rod modification protein FlgD
MATINSATTIQADYLEVLIAQLQNQNPLEPLDNTEMASQLAQFSQLQQLESMNTNFAKVLAATENTYAGSLIGKEVTFFKQTETGDLIEMSGTVKKVFNDPEEGILLILETTEGDYTLGLDGIISVGN